MFKRLFRLGGLVALLIAAAVATASAQSNVALVIGNSGYQNAKPLHTTISDAAAVAETIRAAGYDVITANDVPKREIGLVMREFLDKLAAAGSNTVGFFYYAGYAAQFNGENYLIPVDAAITGSADIANQALRLGELVAALSGTPAAARIMVLDASYAYDFGNAAPPQTGLAIMAAPAGLLIASATAPDQVAAEGTGSNSVYAAALASLMRQPGLDLEHVFRAAAAQVTQATAGRQTPSMVSALVTDVTLFQAPAPPTAAVPPAAPPQTHDTKESPKKKTEHRAEPSHPKRAVGTTDDTGTTAQPAYNGPPPIPLGIGIGSVGFGIGIGR